MRRIALVITFVAGLIASAFAQKAEIEAANAKWIEFFVISPVSHHSTPMTRPHSRRIRG